MAFHVLAKSFVFICVDVRPRNEIKELFSSFGEVARIYVAGQSDDGSQLCFSVKAASRTCIRHDSM